MKRKHKSSQSGKDVWWFVLQADVLQPLEAGWEAISLQTGWHLEPCTRPVSADNTLSACTATITNHVENNTPNNQDNGHQCSSQTSPIHSSGEQTTTQYDNRPEDHSTLTQSTPPGTTFTTFFRTNMSGNSSHLPINVRGTAEGKRPQQPKLSKPISPCHILYYNARSLLPKLDELRAIADAENPDEICITESWISNEVKNDELTIANYQILRLDRNRHGGGVLLYVHCFFSVNVLPNINPGLELLTVSIECHNPYHKFCIALFYRPPSSSKDIFNSLFNVLHSLNPIVFNNFILIGDFNVNCFLTDSYLYKHLMYCLSPFSFHQIVQSGTHQSSSGNSSLIDLVLYPTLHRCVLVPLSHH